MTQVLRDEPLNYTFDFDEAVERLAQTDPAEVAAIQHEQIPDPSIDALIRAFEAHAHRGPSGDEFWYARDLQILLEYRKWESFEDVIKRAMLSCEKSGHRSDDHFRHIRKMITIMSGAERELPDVMMDRYACYLTAQNGDPKKRAVAFAQTYFAIQTRRQELSDQSDTAIPMSEDEKRVFLRNQIKEHNRHLSSAAKGAGVITPLDFSIFHSRGYQGLYGKTVPEVKYHKGISGPGDILDRMGSTELAANFFRVTQTEEKLRKDQIRGKENANETHFAVGRQVREAMLTISGIAPEDLPVADSIKLAEKRLKLLGQPPQPPSTKQPLPEPPAAAPAPAAEAAPATATDLKPIDLTKDLWKYALLVMVQQPGMQITTSRLIKELPKYIVVPSDARGINLSRGDSKFSQLVRNLKSHRRTPTNFIFQGFAEAVPGGFRATKKGWEFVLEYFDAG
jgi:hypothetical protein